jgi:hypothetical protein
VVAERQHVRPRREQGLRHVGGEAEAVAGVLGVDDGQVDPQRLPQFGQGRGGALPAGAADGVA